MVSMPAHYGTAEPGPNEGSLPQDIFGITGELHERLGLTHSPCGCSDCGNL